MGKASARPRVILLILAAMAAPAARAAAPAEARMFHYPEQLKPLELDKAGSNDWSVAVKRIEPTGGVAYPGEMVGVDLVVRNTGSAPLQGVPVVKVVRIGTRFERYDTERGDPMQAGQIIATVPLGQPRASTASELQIAPGREGGIRWRQVKAEDFVELGTYAVIVEMPGKGRQAAATFARVHPPSPAAGDGKNCPLLYPLHPGFDVGWQLESVRRLGYRWVHAGSMPNWASVSQPEVVAPFEWGRADAWIEPFRNHGLYILSHLCGSPRQTITEANWNGENLVHDPKHDARFGDFVEAAVRRYCGPDGKGPLQIIDFWDRPWEGGGGAGWNSDAARYRTLYQIVYERAHKGSRHIAVGGTSSAANTLDKFFTQAGAEATWGSSFDVLSDRGIQPYACFGTRLAQKLACSAVETESWLGASPELLVAAATHLTAAGYRKVSPAHPTQLLWQNGPGGPMPTPSAAAASFFLHFLAGLDFELLLPHDHLPWVYQWGGGDRVVYILAGDRHGLDTQAVTLYDQIRANGTIALDALEGKLKAYDLFGNPYPVEDGKYRLPCSAASVYLEAPGLPREAIARAVLDGRIDGVKPVEFFVDDFTQPVERAKTLDLEIHNVLTKRVNGTVTVTPPPTISLQRTTIAVSIAAGAREAIRLPIDSGNAKRTNVYPFSFRFEGKAGNVEWHEDLRVNTIAYGQPTIDGDLKDWADAIPVYVHAHGREVDLTEAVWSVEEQLKDIPKGLASVRFLWDEDRLYVGVRDRERDWRPRPRLSTRNDADYFGKGDLAHTYVKPIEDALPYTGDRFQLGLRVEPLRFRLPTRGGVPRQMLAEDDTDYEYALWGTPDAGAEVWRSNAPKLGFFNFLPRCMPEGYDGVPKGAKAVVKRDGGDTIYEAAIPLADLGGLAPAPGKIIHITFALPASGVYLGAGRSRTRTNALTLKPTWQSYPSNEIRWGFLAKK